MVRGRRRCPAARRHRTLPSASGAEIGALKTYELHAASAHSSRQWGRKTTQNTNVIVFMHNEHEQWQPFFAHCAVDLIKTAGPRTVHRYKYALIYIAAPSFQTSVLRP